MWASCIAQLVKHMPAMQDQFSSVAQSCPTLCDPVNCSTPGLPVHHQVTSVMSNSVWPYGLCQAPLSMGFSRQGYWSGLLCPPPGYLPDFGIEHVSPALQVVSLPLSHQEVSLEFIREVS